MQRSKAPLERYLLDERREIYRQFKGDQSSGQNNLIIGAYDHRVLSGSGLSIVNVSGYSLNDAVIVTRPSGVREFFANPALRDHRDAQKAFFEQINVETGSAFDRRDSDHVFHLSAALGQVGLVKMLPVLPSVNRSYGAGLEKRRTHDAALEPLVIGEFTAMLKCSELGLVNPRDPVGSLRLGVEMMILSGIASPSDRPLLLQRVEECVSSWQAHDERYAELYGGVDLSPGTPLVKG